MNEATIHYLNIINREFYQTTAASFDASRSQPWPGWEYLLPHLEPPLSILDVGCGNGRFGRFLIDQLGTNLTYYGVDSNPDLLASARSALPGLDARLEHRDIITDPLTEGEYDLVALFGMIHHVPGFQQRRDFIHTLAQRVAPGGLFAFAAWRFYDYERFRDRIVPWPDDIEVERHDYLLDWRRDVRAVRYCHYVDDAEHAELVTATGLTEIAAYRADGHAGDVNRYSLLRRDKNHD
ncbi:MAG: class I SAM-dependent methyltransferase [Anaerolineae bacterium]|nr:class I SAM-dependent methyltransferase [Anaerolineae bacterium]